MYPRLIAGLLGLALAVPAHAATVTVFDNKSVFLSRTGASSATGPIPPLGFVSNTPTTVGSVTFTGPNGGLWFGAVGVSEVDWTTLLPGHEIAINSFENMDVSFATPVYSYGFDFVEPQFSTPNINAPFVDSTFAVSLFSNSTPVGAFTFNAPNDVAAFAGVWTDMAFNNVQIREIVGGIENEFFGEVYTGGRRIPGCSGLAPGRGGAVPPGQLSPPGCSGFAPGQLSAVPIPAALPLFLTALAGLGLLGWRRRQTA
jgi:hypothetical protein